MLVFVVGIALIGAPDSPAPNPAPVEESAQPPVAVPIELTVSPDPTAPATSDAELVESSAAETVPETVPELVPESDAGDVASSDIHAAPEVPTAAAVALAEANRLFDAGKLAMARETYASLIQVYPDSPEAALAGRMLRALEHGAKGRVPAVAPAGPALDRDDGRDTVYSKELYSLRTNERTAIGVWEKIDFGVTAFAYGASVGASWVGTVDVNDAGAVTMPIVAGSLTYLVGSLLYLFLADPDRGDLPLVLGAASYIPTSTMLIATLADADGSAAAWAGAISGTLALPIALLLGYYLDLDPGDTQLARDVGFWLAVLCTGTASAIVVQMEYQGPGAEARVIPGAALAGLWAGIGLGTLWAYKSEISLERVRVTTWAGYGGTVVGTLIGIPLMFKANGNPTGMIITMTVGAALGLATGFVASGSLDDLPADVRFLDDTEITFLQPTILPAPMRNGQSGMAFGINLASGRF